MTIYIPTGKVTENRLEMKRYLRELLNGDKEELYNEAQRSGNILYIQDLESQGKIRLNNSKNLTPEEIETYKKIEQNNIINKKRYVEHDKKH